MHHIDFCKAVYAHLCVILEKKETTKYLYFFQDILSNCEDATLHTMYNAFKSGKYEEKNDALTSAFSETINKIPRYQRSAYQGYIDKFSTNSSIKYTDLKFGQVLSSLDQAAYNKPLQRIHITAVKRLQIDIEEKDPPAAARNNSYSLNFEISEANPAYDHKLSFKECKTVDNATYLKLEVEEKKSHLKDLQDKTYDFIMSDKILRNIYNFHVRDVWRFPLEIFHRFGPNHYDTFKDADFNLLNALDDSEFIKNFWKITKLKPTPLKTICREAVERAYPTLHRNPIRVLVSYIIETAKCKNVDIATAALLSFYYEIIVRYDFGQSRYYFAYLRAKDKTYTSTFYVVERIFNVEKNYDILNVEFAKSDLVFNLEA